MIEKLYEHFKKYPSVTTDTRKISEGQIFFALKGPHFNGNEYAQQALEKGASMVVVDEITELIPADKVFMTGNVLTTLQQLANHHRKQFDIPVLAITGSNGKTTTKELLKAVLSKKYDLLVTKGNLNNHIGVPLTLLELTGDHDFAVIEMGANRVGDIRELCEIAEPTHGLITSIGTAHIETFGSAENILRGKTELFDFVRDKEAAVFLNTHDPKLRHMTHRFKAPVTFPNAGDSYPVEFIDANPFLTLRYDEELFETRLMGKHHYGNVAAAIATGRHFGVDVRQAISAVSDYTPDNNRMQVVKTERNTLILDAYNANPDSMGAALELLFSLSADKKMAILGDMLELGDHTRQAHEQVGKMLHDHNMPAVLFGTHMAMAYEEHKDAAYFEDKQALFDYLKGQNSEGFTILIKGSRGMAMESVVDYL